MKCFATSRNGLQACLLGGLISALVLAAGCGNKPPPPAPAKPKTADASKGKGAAAAPVADTNQYASVFEDLPPEKGLDPFYPDSTYRIPKNAPVRPGVPVAPDFVLKAIVHTAKRSQAVINNAVLEVGDPMESIRTPTGRARVKCLEIGDDYVVIQVEGEPAPKRVPMVRKRIDKIALIGERCQK